MTTKIKGKLSNVSTKKVIKSHRLIQAIEIKNLKRLQLRNDYRKKHKKIKTVEIILHEKKISNDKLFLSFSNDHLTP